MQIFGHLPLIPLCITHKAVVARSHLDIQLARKHRVGFHAVIRSGRYTERICGAVLIFGGGNKRERIALCMLVIICAHPQINVVHTILTLNMQHPVFGGFGGKRNILKAAHIYKRAVVIIKRIAKRILYAVRNKIGNIKPQIHTVAHKNSGFFGVFGHREDPCGKIRASAAEKRQITVIFAARNGCRN